jgi:amino acid transporter
MWTAFSSVFSLLSGYSRVPYAAALDGNYFKIFAKCTRNIIFHMFPYSTMGGIAMLFCFFKLADVIAGLVVIRIIVQFVAQIVGLLVIASDNPEMPRPFKMWLYPYRDSCTGRILFVLFSRQGFLRGHYARTYDSRA